MISEEQMERLPMYAREHIQVQDKRIEELRQTLLDFTGNQESQTSLEHFPQAGDLTMVPDDTRLRFHFGPEHLTVSRERDFLEILGSSMIAVYPRSGNLVLVCAIDRRRTP